MNIVELESAHFYNSNGYHLLTVDNQLTAHITGEDADSHYEFTDPIVALCALALTLRLDQISTYDELDSAYKKRVKGLKVTEGIDLNKARKVLPRAITTLASRRYSELGNNVFLIGHNPASVFFIQNMNDPERAMNTLDQSTLSMGATGNLRSKLTRSL